jgi:hypothetical protein
MPAKTEPHVGLPAGQIVAVQTPLLQLLEQQSLASEQVLPSFLHLPQTVS